MSLSRKKRKQDPVERIPFLGQRGDKRFIKLHSALYPDAILAKVNESEPGSIGAVRKTGDYYFVELRADTQGECFDFLNYLIYLRRAQ
jgi:hypothetical protein